MATNYTEHYGLCQWEPGDKFLREEFNQDNAKIDAALKAAEEAAAARAGEVEDNARSWANAAQSAASTAQRTADRALSALEPVGYNVYNLMLQNYYDGKVTGWKKALIFDGFQDQSGIQTLSGGVWDASNPSLLLDGVGQGNVPSAAKYDTYRLPKLQSVAASWTATGNGVLTHCAITVLGQGTIEFFQGTRLLATGDFRTGQDTGGTVNVPLSAPVTAGQTYSIKITNTGSSDLYLNSDSNDIFCFALTFTPSRATNGVMTGNSQPVSGTFQRAKVWVRYSGGTVNCSLMGNSGSWKSLTRGTSRTTFNADGVSCTETEFSLNSALTGPIQARLDLSVSSGSKMRVYDYGIILL